MVRGPWPVTSDDGVDHAHPAIRYLGTIATAWNEAELDRATSLLDPDLIAWSHRTVVARDTKRGTEAHDAVLSFHAYLPCCRFDVIATHAHDLTLTTWTLRSADGKEVQSIPLVIRIGPTSRLVRAATFDPDDDGARTVFEQWAASAEPNGRLDIANAAARLGDEVEVAYESSETAGSVARSRLPLAAAHSLGVGARRPRTRPQWLSRGGPEPQRVPARAAVDGPSARGRARRQPLPLAHVGAGR